MRGLVVQVVGARVDCTGPGARYSSPSDSSRSNAGPWLTASIQIEAGAGMDQLSGAHPEVKRRSEVRLLS